MAAELLRAGLTPGCEAPDFDLPSTDGSRARLRDLQGQPVLLHLVSYTCPVTRGGMSTMRELHRLYGDRVRFVEMLVRQAHPGELHGAYRSYEDKVEEARAYGREDRTPWPVLVDDLAGTVQRLRWARLRRLPDRRSRDRRFLRDLGPITGPASGHR